MHDITTQLKQLITSRDIQKSQSCSTVNRSLTKKLDIFNIRYYYDLHHRSNVINTTNYIDRWFDHHLYRIVICINNKQIVTIKPPLQHQGIFNECIFCFNLTPLAAWKIKNQLLNNFNRIFFPFRFDIDNQNRRFLTLSTLNNVNIYIKNLQFDNNYDINFLPSSSIDNQLINYDNLEIYEQSWKHLKFSIIYLIKLNLLQKILESNKDENKIYTQDIKYNDCNYNTIIQCLKNKQCTGSFVILIDKIAKSVDHEINLTTLPFILSLCRRGNLSKWIKRDFDVFY